MKTSTLRIIYILLLITAMGCQEETNTPVPVKNSLKKAGLLGKVKSVNTQSFKAINENGNTSRQEKIKQVYTSYNPNGFLVEKTEYPGDGSVDKKTTSTFNDLGFKTQATEHKPDGSPMWNYTYKLDQNGNRTGAIKYHPSGREEMSWTYAYDENGNETEVIQYKPDNKMLWKSKYQYDKQGKKLEWILYDHHWEPEMETSYDYDNQGTLISENEMIYKDKKQKSTVYIHNSFDEKGNWTERITLKNGRLETIEDRIIEYYQ